nr:hypothetical protein [Tanacetum cinerariifolium]
MEAEVDQHVVDKKCDEIERKNLLIENVNLIVKCLSKDVFYTAVGSVLIVSRFFDMHDAYTVAHKRIAELEAENSNVTQKIQKNDHDEMIKHFSKLETTSLLNEIKTLKAQIKEKTNCVTMPNPVKPKVLFPSMYAIDVEPIPPRNRNNREVHLEYLKNFKESLGTLHSKEFVNVFMRINFGSTIKLVSFDENQVVTFYGKFVCDFRNSDCGTRSQSDNTVDNPHAFIIHEIRVLNGNEKVTEVINVDNWRIDNSRVLRWVFL